MLRPFFLLLSHALHCPLRMVSSLWLMGGADLHARLNRAQLGPFVTQRLLGPRLLVLGVLADWILFLAAHSHCTPARVAWTAGRSNSLLLASWGTWGLLAAVLGADWWGLQVRALWIPAQSSGLKGSLVNICGGYSGTSLSAWWAVVGDCGWIWCL